MKNIQSFYDNYSLAFIFDHGFKYDNETGHLYIAKKQYNNLQYKGSSIKDHSIKTICLPSIHGMMLLFEKKHFTII
jgi:hypothetical protein